MIGKLDLEVRTQPRDIVYITGVLYLNNRILITPALTVIML